MSGVMVAAGGGGLLVESERRVSGRATGRCKAAMLLLSVGLERAALVLERLREDEVEALSLEMAQLSQVDALTIDGVLEEFIATVQARESLVIGGVEYANELLERALGPDRAQEIISRMASVIEKRPFGFLRNVAPERIATLLREEATATAALVIASLHKTLAAQVMGQMPEGDQGEIAERIAQMAPVAPDVLRAVEDGVRRRLSTIAHEDVAATGGVDCLAQILKHGDQSSEETVMEYLADANGDLAGELRELLFTFEDISTLDDHSIQLVLREADLKDLAVALRGASDQLTHRILSNLSTRGAEMLRDDLQYLPPQRKRIVQTAQGKIVGIVRRLEDAGALIVARGEDEIVI